MAFDLHDATIPLYRQVLSAMGKMLEKAETHCAQSGIPPETLLQARLYDDMWPFNQQMNATVSHSIRALDSVVKTGVFTPDPSAPAETFVGLKAQNASARAQLESFTSKEINSRIGDDVVFQFGERRMVFTAEGFLQSFSLSNFYFHASMAYAILRHNGVPVGKRDFLGALRLKPLD